MSPRPIIGMRWSSSRPAGTARTSICQKPETRTLREGPLMVEAARRYGRVVSGGSQRVLEDYRDRLANQCWSGELGTIKSINVNVGPLSLALQPARRAGARGHRLGHVAWPGALGPVPSLPHQRQLQHQRHELAFLERLFRRRHDRLGRTHFGGAMFAADVRELEPVEVIYHDDKDGQVPDLPLPNGVLIYHNHPKMGNMQVVGTPGEKRAAKPSRPTRARAASTATSSTACKTREKPFRDIELATHTMAVCHLGIIAYELKRSLKWDQAKQEFPGDEEANRFLDRARREPWVL